MLKNFKRDIYYNLLDLLKQTNVIFLLGPRKCGKTFALNQIDDEMANTRYFDFKKLSEDESMNVIENIVEHIHTGEDVIYLLDETTHMFFPEEEISKLAGVYTKAKQQGMDIKTKIIFAGSQSVALEAWGRRAFCNQARFLKADFLSYSEWLRYENREDVTADSYLDFIQGTSEFYEFTSVEDYLKGCLDETVVSNANARNLIYGNDCDLVEVDTLLDILYISMFTLHDTSSAQSFFKSRAFSDKMVYLAKQIGKANPLCSTEVRDRVAKSFVSRYDNVKATDIDTLKQSFAFLMRCGLLSATPVFQDMEHENINVLKQLEDSEGLFRKKGDLLGHVNFTINYPMFFVEIVKEIFKDDLPHGLDNMLVGSIVECHVRGLLPNKNCFEYRDEEGREIDYLNRLERLAVEITISNKTMDNVHLDLIQEEEAYKKILLTRDVKAVEQGMEKIPYYDFIYELSGGSRSE